ncbi:hypothetical protein [Demequina gelatinilytica]|uniref:hypothetical protein n=1 Tax=Demequina gelatinilytica TaxID=1638980 RepID=UPI0007818A48|nr:hypothetical protein [Demequina gelatinilytica]
MPDTINHRALADDYLERAGIARSVDDHDATAALVAIATHHQLAALTELTAELVDHVRFLAGAEVQRLRDEEELAKPDPDIAYTPSLPVLLYTEPDPPIIVNTPIEFAGVADDAVVEDATGWINTAHAWRSTPYQSLTLPARVLVRTTSA